MKDFLPLMLDLSGKEVVIFGGGDVGERKAALFCEYAHVIVVSREFTPSLEELSKKGKINLIKADISEKDISEYLKNAFIAIPATNDVALNEKIAGFARERGILINRVDGLGNIIVPSVIKRGDIVIGISTLGQSPALSKYIRERIEEVITPGFAEMSRLQKEIREILKTRVEDQKKRKKILWGIINDSEVWTALGESYDKAYMLASKHIDRNIND
ncbi:MAG: bifunctional precorrin-2 dehydrogenase/sirohydrochlorin ferrochelatase [Candidatus Methanoperedens sp.]|nr:bifunctional precorrin-2 dehydrogenase/sirohydrochlorin ferrochelatase [Candidatus Methanoperedens sp.]